MLDLQDRMKRISLRPASVPSTPRASPGHKGSFRAVFIDRDGVLNEDTIHTYDPSEMKVIEGCQEALTRFKGLGFLRVVVSNQAGVAKALFTLEQMVSFDEKLWSVLGDRPWDSFYFCPYHLEGTVPEYAMESPDRKPSPGMILRAALELDIDLTRSYMVGDHLKDVIAAHRAGCKGMLVMTGRGKSELQRLLFAPARENEAVPDAVVEDLRYASLLIEEWER